MTRSIPAPKRSLNNFFEKLSPQPMQDFEVTKKVGDYGIRGPHADYTITTRFVKLDNESISTEMLANGQIVEEYADGIPLDKMSIYQPDVAEAIIAQYLDFSNELEKIVDLRLDSNISRDLIAIIDDELKTITVIRIDATPTNNKSFIYLSLAQEINDIAMNLSLPNDIISISELYYLYMKYLKNK